MNNERITSGEVSAMAFSVTVSTNLVLLPVVVIPIVKQDAWWIILAGTFITMGIVYAYLKLWEMFPEMTLYEISRELLGKWGSWIVGLLLVYFFFYIAAIILWEIGDVISTAFLPNTPLPAINIVIMIVAIYAARSGIEIISRLTYLLLPLVLFFFVMLMALPADTYSFQHLQPNFYFSFKHYAIATSHVVMMFTLIMVCTVLFPYVEVKHAKRLKKTFLLFALGSYLIITLFTLLFIAAFSAEYGSHLLYPVYQMAKLVDIKRFLENAQVITLGIWITTIFIKVNVFIFASIHVLMQMTGCKDYRPLTVPTGMLLIPVALTVYKSQNEFHEWLQIGPVHLLPVQVGLPLILLIIAIIRKKFGVNAG